MDEWRIRFHHEGGDVWIDESSPIVCEGWNIWLFCPELLAKVPEWMPDEVNVIGIFGDSEIAWVCRGADGAIFEVDEYDRCVTGDALRSASPSVAHYLLRIVDG